MIFRYEIPDNSFHAKIILADLLGSVVSEFNLDKESAELSFELKDLSPGVYFYSLLVEGKTIEAKKLVVVK